VGGPDQVLDVVLGGRRGERVVPHGREVGTGLLGDELPAGARGRLVVRVVLEFVESQVAVLQVGDQVGHRGILVVG
jgi:hypothetical protein